MMTTIYLLDAFINEASYKKILAARLRSTGPDKINAMQMKEELARVQAARKHLAERLLDCEDKLGSGENEVRARLAQEDAEDEASFRVKSGTRSGVGSRFLPLKEWTE